VRRDYPFGRFVIGKIQNSEESNEEVLQVGIGFGVLVGLISIGSVVIYFKSQARLTRVYDLPEKTVAISMDTESIQRGHHIFQFRGCEACHSGGGYIDVSGSDQPLDSHLSLPSHAERVPHMEGNIYLDDPAIGMVIASNLTSGRGGVGAKIGSRIGSNCYFHSCGVDSACCTAAGGPGSLHHI
jgi:hypothetical protein